jgi:serine/threonine protein kinase
MEFIDKYEIIKKISHGCFSSAYLGIDKTTKNQVVLKIESRSQGKSMLQRELFILKILRPSLGRKIIDILDWGNTDTHRYLVFPFKGFSLAECLKKKKKMSEKIIMTIGNQLLNILESIHALEVLHGDISPHNILLTQCSGDNKVFSYIIDFGCSSLVEQMKLDEEISSGSPCFSSPFIFTGQTYSYRDDLLSLFFVLSYAYLGFLPWQQGCYNKSVKFIKSNHQDYLYKEPVPKMLKIAIEYVSHLKDGETANYSMLKRIINVKNHEDVEVQEGLGLELRAYEQPEDQVYSVMI